jgi:chromosome segregation ATPase
MSNTEKKISKEKQTISLFKKVIINREMSQLTSEFVELKKQFEIKEANFSKRCKQYAINENDLKKKLTLNEEHFKINEEKIRKLELENNNLRNIKYDCNEKKERENDLNKKMKDLETSNCYLKEQIVSLTSALNIQNKINLDFLCLTERSQVEGVVNNLKRNISSYVQKIKFYDQESHKLKSKLVEYETSLNELKNINSEMLHEKETTKNKYNSQLSYLEEKLRHCQIDYYKEVDELKNKHRLELIDNDYELSQSRNKIKEKVLEKDNVIASLNEKNLNLESKLVNYLEEIKEKNSKLEEQEKIFNAKISKQINDKSQFTDKITKQKEEINRLQSCIQKHKEKEEALNKNLNKCNAQILETVKENFILKIDLEELSCKMEKQVIRLKIEIDQLTNEKADLIENYKHVDQLSQSTQTQISRLVDRSTQATFSNTMSYRSKDDANDKFKFELEKKSSIISQLMEKANKFEMQLMDTKCENDRLLSINISMKDKISSIEQNFKKIAYELTDKYVLIYLLSRKKLFLNFFFILELYLKLKYLLTYPNRV